VQRASQRLSNNYKYLQFIDLATNQVLGTEPDMRRPPALLIGFTL